MARRYGTALLCIAGMCALPGAVSAAGVVWQASAGFEKTWKEGRWTPIFVDIQNTGPSRTGELRIVLSVAPGRGPSTSYGTRVELPQNSRKRYCICVPSAPTRVALLDLGWGWEKKEIEEGTRVSGRDTLVVVVGEGQGYLSFLRGEPALPQLLGDVERSSASSETGELQVAHVGWDQLPDRWLGWDCADVVVVGEGGHGSATPEGLRALAEWVRLGGTLVVPGGPAGPSLAGSPLAPLLPMSVSGTAPAASIAQLGAWIGVPIKDSAALLCTGTLRQGARVLCGDRDTPLVTVGRADGGRVVMATFDYRAAAIRQWDGHTGLWHALVQPAAVPPSLVTPAAFAGNGYYSSEWNLPEVAKFAPQARLPSLWLVGLFLLAYIVVLVPVNYLALRRIDRMELAWLTSPLIVIAFTLAAYFIGYAVRGGQLIVNRVAVVETNSGDRLAPGRGFVGIFSPTRARYQMTLPHSAAAAEPAMRPDEWGRRLPVFQCEDPVRVTNIAMDMWTSEAIATRFALDLGRGISGVVQHDGRGYEATIFNGAPFALGSARLVIGGAAGPQADILAGASGVLSLAPGQPGTVTGYPIGGEPPYGSQSKPPQLDEMAVYSLFLDRYRHYGPGPSPTPPQAAAWLLAFADPAIGVGSLNRKPNRTQDISVVLVRLPVRFAARQTAPVPPAAIAVRPLPVGIGAAALSGGVYGKPPGMGGYVPGMHGASGQGGLAVWEYTLPLTPATHRVDKLSIEVATTTTMVPAPAPGPSAAHVVAGQTVGTPTVRCSVYNVTTGRWEEQEKATPLDLNDPKQYIDAEGKLLVKQVFSGGWPEAGPPQLTVLAALEE